MYTVHTGIVYDVVCILDYSLVPLLIQQNYIDSSRNGVCRAGGNMSESDKIDALSKAASAVSDMDLIGSNIMGVDNHWELLPSQAAMCMRVGSVVQGFQGFPTFPAVSPHSVEVFMKC